MSEIDFGVDINILKSNIDYHIDKLGQDQKLDKNKTTYIAIYNGFSAAATTALIGISQYIEKYDYIFQIMALLVSATQAILNAWDNLFNHKGLWIIAARSRRKFYALREDIQHAESTQTLTPELTRYFYNTYKSILEERNKAWDELRVGAANSR